MAEDISKPEIAVALGRFEVFVGWKPLPEIQSLITNIPISKSKFVTSSKTNFNTETSKDIVRKTMKAPDSDIMEIHEILKKTPGKEFGKHLYIPEFLPRLAEQYHELNPGNIFALLTMNYLVLQKGESIYVPAGGIHAHLSGDIVECMVRSDNVLNTGFCPRADRDSIDSFTAALIFSPKNADEAVLKPKATDKGERGHTKILAPPMSTFDMLVTELGSGESETIKLLHGPGILIVKGGEGVLKAEGKECEVKEGLETYIAFAEA